MIETYNILGISFVALIFLWGIITLSIDLYKWIQKQKTKE